MKFDEFAIYCAGIRHNDLNTRISIAIIRATLDDREKIFNKRWDPRTKSSRIADIKSILHALNSIKPEYRNCKINLFVLKRCFNVVDRTSGGIFLSKPARDIELISKVRNCINTFGDISFHVMSYSHKYYKLCKSLAYKEIEDAGNRMGTTQEGSGQEAHS